MAGTLVKDIVGSVIVELSQVPGIATQVYSSGRIRQFVQDAYQMEIDEIWWPRYMWWQSVPIDPATGMLTADLKGPISYIDEYEDIRAVFPGNSNRALPEFPQSMNPSTRVGGMNAFIMPDYTIEHRPVKVIPTDVGVTDVTIHARQGNRLPLRDEDTVYIDGLLLQYDAAWAYCVDDGTVPAQVNKFQMLAAKRRTQLKTALAQQPLLLDPRYRTGDNMWGDDNPFFVLDSDVLA